MLSVAADHHLPQHYTWECAERHEIVKKFNVAWFIKDFGIIVIEGSEGFLCLCCPAVQHITNSQSQRQDKYTQHPTCSHASEHIRAYRFRNIYHIINSELNNRIFFSYWFSNTYLRVCSAHAERRVSASQAQVRACNTKGLCLWVRRICDTQPTVDLTQRTLTRIRVRKQSNTCTSTLAHTHSTHTYTQTHTTHTNTFSDNNTKAPTHLKGTQHTYLYLLLSLYLLLLFSHLHPARSQSMAPSQYFALHQYAHKSS